jgi:methylamine---glutamate N-methyltransferase subunit C
MEMNMFVLQCNLCLHEYDESVESIPWDELPADWVCPVCGSPKTSFTRIGGGSEKHPSVENDQNSLGGVYACGLCSWEYNEEIEGVSREELSDEWVCPICGSTMSSFIDLEKPKPTSNTSSKSSILLTDVYECGLCSFEYIEEKEGVSWEDLPNDWTCPVCGSGKESFSHSAGTVHILPVSQGHKDVDKEYLAEWRRQSDEFESHMADIHQMAVVGKSISEPMRSRIPSFNWDDILVKGAQLFKMPLNKSQPVNTHTVIGPGAAVPLVIESPIIVTHMSFGALSREAKLSLAKGSAVVKTAMCSGEGGILPECIDAAHKYIFEYVPNKYSVTNEYLSKVDAVEIKIGQSAKPGMGGHLPAHKVTKEIARIRGFRVGREITSPAHFPDIRTKEDLKNTVDSLREKTGDKPIGIKLAAGHLEEDIAIAIGAGADFITIDGRAGGTGSAPKVVKNSASVPTIFALARARKVLDELGATNVSLIITGSFRISSDMAKALAMGADAIAIGTAAMMAVGCQQYRICDTDKCPVGIATQNPALRARLDVNKSAERVANFFRVSTEEIKDFARLTGNDDVHGLTPVDLCTSNTEISNYTNIGHV